MSIFDYTDYKSFLREWLLARPKRGHGESRKMALHLGVSTTMISQVLNGPKDLSLELAMELGEYLSLTSIETEYFLALVEHSRAGSHKLKNQFYKKIKAMQEEAQKIKARVEKDKELSLEEKNMFYSNWLYSGLRNLIATEKFKTVDDLADKLKMPRYQVQKVLDFLIQTQLVVLDKNKLTYGFKSTHVGVDSPLVNSHHKNWRLRSMEVMAYKNEKDLFYTAPMSLSAKDAQKLRDQILAFIQELVKTVQKSDSEVVRCIGIDFFEY
jgi:uncharacterized protein (TIGR02147 family)